MELLRHRCARSAKRVTPWTALRSVPLIRLCYVISSIHISAGESCDCATASLWPASKGYSAASRSWSLYHLQYYCACARHWFGYNSQSCSRATSQTGHDQYSSMLQSFYRNQMPDADITKFIEDCLERVPDLYLDELQALLRSELDVTVGYSTVHRTLQQRNWTHKTVSSTMSKAQNAPDADW